MELTDKTEIARKLEQEGGDSEEILSLLLEAANLGDAEAIYAIGTFYLHGKYLDKDVSKGVRFIARAAKKNWAAAAFDLGVAYETGDFVEKDLSEAFQNYLRAMMLGDLSGAEEVCRCLYYGIGTAKNQELYDDLNGVLEAIRHREDK
ncbi:hypothetical protein ABLN87_15510 [Ruegeria sp. SCPT10]|uniref:tetratricopeptide repeat protein n=1 Tax=Ruegeria sp. SCP10 TaxID=3141377 RepID=UPI0033377F2C